MINIYRDITKVLTVEPLRSSSYIEALMGEHQITLMWEQRTHVALHIGDHITFEGVTYKLNKLPTIKKLSTRLYQYNAVFQPPRYDTLKVILMLFDNTATPAQGEFTLTGTAETFVDLFVANMNRVSSGWAKGDVVESEPKTLTFSNESCHAVMERLAVEFDTEFHVLGKTLHLDKKATSREITLEYGSTVYDIERTSVSSQDIVTRLYPFGSDKNIALNYRSGSTRLLLPSPATYIDSDNVEAYGVIEQAKKFDDIYPRLSLLGAGVVTSVGDKYAFSDSAINFNVNDCLFPGVPAIIRFLTGECAGYDFEIKSYNNSTQTFTILENSKDKELVLPTDLLKPAVGNKYVLLDVKMPADYLEAAEEELLLNAQEHLDANDTAKVDYRVNFSSLYAKEHVPVIQCADQVQVVDTNLGINEGIRIVKLQKGIPDVHNIQIELSNTVSQSTLQRIAGQIGSLNNEIIVSSEYNKRRGIEAYQRTRELQNMVFDPDGYFDTENIRPLSIETGMLSVGARSQQFQLTCLLQPNYNGNPQSIYWSAGTLMHFSLVDGQVKEWVMASGNTTITGDSQTKALYIYARCPKTGTTGDIHLSPVATKFDSDGTYWYFLLGILHSPLLGVRGISLSYGQTTINGQFIRTGVISSTDGGTSINLNTGEIRGNIKFKSGSEYIDVGDGINIAIDKVQVGGSNLLQQSQNGITQGSNNSAKYPTIYTKYDGYSSVKRVAPFVDEVLNTFAGGNAFYETEIGEKYMVSVDVMVTGSPITVSIDTVNYFTLSPNVWKRISCQVTATSASTRARGFLSYDIPVDQELFYKNYKAEKGTKETGWSPSHADVQKKIDDTNNYINSVSNDLQNQIDGVVDSWFYGYVPELLNFPASEWTTDVLKDRHVGDTFTNTQTYIDEATTPHAGKSWRWTAGHVWTPIADSDAVKALLKASQAQDTADGKRRVFTTKPTNAHAYDVGDLWVNATDGAYVNELLRATISKIAGATYNLSHWSKATKYTDDTAANAAQQTANNAANQALAANTKLGEWAEDSTLSPVEKKGVKNEWEKIALERDKIFAQADMYGIVTEKDNYSLSHTNLYQYLNEGTTPPPLLANLETDSPIDRVVFKSKFSDYYNNRQLLLSAIAEAAKIFVGTSINDIKIGARNLILKSDFSESLDGIAAFAGTSKILDAGDRCVLTNTTGNPRAHFENLSLDGNVQYIFQVERWWDDIEQVVWRGANYDYVLFEEIKRENVSLESGVRVFYRITLAGSDTGFIQVENATALNEMRLRHPQLERGTIPTAWASSQEDSDARVQAFEYLREAVMADNTTIQGGLLGTTLLQLKDGATDAITGGVSGVQADNIGFWTGGTYAEALSGLAKVLLRKDGSGHFAGGNLSWDDLGKLLFGKIGDGETIKISTDEIISLANINKREVYNPVSIVNLQTVRNLNNPAHDGIDMNTSYEYQFLLEHDADYLRVDVGVFYYVGANVQGFGSDGVVSLEKLNGTTWVALQESLSADERYIDYDAPVTKGLFRLVWNITCGWTGVNGSSAVITLSRSVLISYQLKVKRLEIGMDGLALFDSMTNKFFRLSLKDGVAQLRMKLDTDMPGVLATGSIAVGGAHANPWGAKKSTNNATYTATGIYDVPHLAGSVYQAQVVATEDGKQACIVSKGNNTFRVKIYTLSGAAATGSFDYTIYGTN